MNWRRLLALNFVMMLVVVSGVYGAYRYYTQTSRFVTTSDAFIQDESVPIMAEFAGKLVNWKGANGDVVSAGQRLGVEDTGLEFQQLGPAAQARTIANSVQSAAVIASPLSGLLVNVNAVPGQMAIPGVQLAVVINQNKPYVVANINETQVRDVAIGNQVDVSVDAYPDLSLQGTVASIGLTTNEFFALIPAANDASGNYTKVMQTIPVKITLLNDGGRELRPGTSATVRIHRSLN